MSKERRRVELLLVLTTEANQSLAEALAKTLLQRRLAACISLQPVQSYYWWQDELQQDKEVQLLIKTTQEQLEGLQDAIKELHSYAIPEWIHWCASAETSYGSWVKLVITPNSGDERDNDSVKSRGD